MVDGWKLEIDYSPLTIHYWKFIIHNSPLTIHHPLQPNTYNLPPTTFLIYILKTGGVEFSFFNFASDDCFFHDFAIAVGCVGIAVGFLV